MGRAKKSKTPAELSQTEKASQESPAAEKQNSESISVSNAHSQRENPPAGEATATLASTPAAETPPANNDYLQEGIIDGRYQILSILGKGGMGTVFLTKHLVLNRIRAVKVLHPHLCSDGNAVIRFRNEAAAVSALEHANIIAVHDSGANEAGTPYIAMDFVEGEPLSHLLQSEGALPVSRALPIFRQVAEALSHAHEKGIVHRDLKPSNIILEKDGNGEDLVRIVDFGIAKLIHDETAPLPKEGLTMDGMVIGTPLYMSPQQIKGVKLDGATDIYSLGCLMYFTLSGIPPFEGDTYMDVMYKHVNNPPPEFPSLVKVSADLQNIIFRCMEKLPEDRFHTMEELVTQLKKLTKGQSIDRKTLSHVREKNRQKWITVVFFLVGFFVMLALSLLLQNFFDASDSKSAAPKKPAAASGK